MLKPEHETLRVHGSGLLVFLFWHSHPLPEPAGGRDKGSKP